MEVKCVLSGVETQFWYGMRQKVLDARGNKFCIDSQATFASPYVLFTVVFSLKWFKVFSSIIVIRRTELKA